MSTIHELSSVVTLSEYDLFGVPPTQLTVERDIQTEHRPISTITDALSPIQFEINTGIDEYIQIRDCEIFICMRVNLAKTNLATDQKVKTEDWKKICPVNNLLPSMIKQINVSIGNTIVFSTRHYSYMAYTDVLTSYGSQAKRTHLTGALWYKDKTGSMNEINEQRSKLIRPDGDDLTKGCDLELIDPLRIGFFTQNRAILGGVTMSITIYPNDPKFYLMYDSSLVPTVEILDACLYVHRAKVNPAIVEAHHRALGIATAKYFITDKEPKFFTIQKGSLDHSINNAQTGLLPRRVLIALVSNEAQNGHNLYNPYYFKNYSLRYIACFLDGTQFPQRPYTPDFNKKKYIREYYGLFEALNQTGFNSNIDITREEFYDGYTIFAFNFAPDLAEGCTRSGYVSPRKYGTLRIEFKFNHPLAETVSAFVYCEYDSLIEIPLSRVAIKKPN